MRLRLGLLAAAAAGLITVAAAQEMPMWHHLEGMEMLHGLDLSGPQRAQVHQIIQSAMEKSKPIWTKMHAMREQIASQMLASGSVTEAQLAPLVQQQEALRDQLDQLHLQTMLQIRALLTPQQVSQAAELHAKLATLHEQERQLTGEEE